MTDCRNADLFLGFGFGFIEIYIVKEIIYNCKNFIIVNRFQIINVLTQKESAIILVFRFNILIHKIIVGFFNSLSLLEVFLLSQIYPNV